MTSRRVFHILPTLEVGGQEVFVCHMASALRVAGFTTEIVALTGGGPLEITCRQQHIPVHILNQHNRVPGYPATLVSFLRSHQPDLLHSHSGKWFPTVLAGRRCGIPVVHTEHGRYPDEPWWVQFADLVCSWWTAQLVVVSEALRDMMQRRARLQESPILIANGVPIPPPPSHADRARYRALLGIPEKGPLVGTVGRLVPVKDQRTFLRVLAQLATMAPDVQGVIIGEGPLRSALEREAESLGVANRVRFAGLREDAAEVVAAIDVFLNTSLSEGTPIALLEAMAAGCPVVATAVGGIPELLGHGACGRLASVGDIDALATAVLALLRSPDERRRLGGCSRTHVANHHGMAHCSEQYASIYEKVLAAVQRRQ